MQIVSKNLFRLLQGVAADAKKARHLKKKIKNGLNSQKMKYCKKKVV